MKRLSDHCLDHGVSSEVVEIHLRLKGGHRFADSPACHLCKTLDRSGREKRWE